MIYLFSAAYRITSIPVVGKIEPTDKNTDWLYRNYVYSGK